MAISVDKLEAVYEKLLAIVKNDTDKLSETNDIDASMAKRIESYDRVLRSALEYYSNKPVKNEYSETSTEDLVKELE